MALAAADSALLCFTKMEETEIFQGRSLSGQQSAHKLRCYLDYHFGIWLSKYSVAQLSDNAYQLTTGKYGVYYYSCCMKYFQQFLNLKTFLGLHATCYC